MAHAFYHGFLHHALNEGPVFLIDAKNLLSKLDSNAKIKLNSLLIKLSLDKEYQSFAYFLDSKKILNKTKATKNLILNFVKTMKRHSKFSLMKLIIKLRKRFIWTSYRHQISPFSIKYLSLLLVDNYKFLKSINSKASK